MLLLLVQVHDLEFAQIEVQVVEGLKNGNAALKKIHQVGMVYVVAVITVQNVSKCLSINLHVCIVCSIYVIDTMKLGVHIDVHYCMLCHNSGPI